MKRQFLNIKDFTKGQIETLKNLNFRFSEGGVLVFGDKKVPMYKLEGVKKFILNAGNVQVKENRVEELDLSTLFLNLGKPLIDKKIGSSRFFSIKVWCDIMLNDDEEKIKCTREQLEKLFLLAYNKETKLLNSKREVLVELIGENLLYRLFNSKSMKKN